MELTGERGLWLAVLRDGLMLCVVGEPARPDVRGLNQARAQQMLCDYRSDHRDWSQAIRWIQSESRRPTSFRWVCELFDLEPGHLRGLLGQAGVWRKRWPTLRRVDRPLKILRGRRAA